MTEFSALQLGFIVFVTLLVIIFAVVLLVQIGQNRFKSEINIIAPPAVLTKEQQRKQKEEEKEEESQQQNPTTDPPVE